MPRTTYGIDPIAKGEVDAMVAWVTNEGVQLDEAGLKTNVMLLSDYGVDTYEMVLFTTEKMIAEHPDTVKGVVQATFQGMRDVIDNPDQAANLVLAYDNKLNLEGHRPRLQATLPLLNPAGSRLGMMQPDVWKLTQQMMLDQKVLAQPIDLDRVATTKFLDTIADLKRDQIESWIGGSTTALSFLLSDPVRDRLIAFTRTTAPTADEQAGIDGLLSQAIMSASATAEHTTRFRSLFLYLPEGRIVAASDEALLGRVVRQPYFKPSLAAEYVQPPYYAPGSNELVMVVTRRLLDPQGHLVAVLGGQIDLTILGKVMLARSGLGDSGETYLVSLESHYLLTPSRFAGYPLTRAYHSEGIDRALSGQNDAGSYDNYRNPATPVIGVYRWAPEVQAALLAETTTAEALAAADQAQWISAMLMLGVCLIALLIGLLIAMRLARPILALTRVAAGISAGDLDQRAEIHQRNEIGVLAAGFNSMTARLQQYLQSLEQRVAERTSELQQALDTREQTLTELRESIRTREALEQTIQGLSSPVLPVLDGVLAMPLSSIRYAAQRQVIPANS